MTGLQETSERIPRHSGLEPDPNKGDSMKTEALPEAPEAAVSARDSVRYRQIHLDFHTSGSIADVAAEFDGEAFAGALADSGVDSVNVFAKCHHGFSYYPTAVGTMHPGLERDLLGEQIDALHRRGIRAPIYVSVLWDDLAGEQHPEWIVATRSGSLLMRPPLTNHSPNHGQTGWTTMDVSTGYGDYVAAQVTELCERYDVDGFWFDIVWPEPNYSPAAQAKLRAAGVPLDDDEAVHAYAVEQLHAFMGRISAVVSRLAPHASVFFNGSVNARVGDTLVHQTHLEVESLPTSGADWGYLHYPVVSRFARTFGVPFVGMTGRFHKSWADFGGLKTPNQLLYECGTILSAGGRISIGDQLDPSGRLDPAVYRTIGSVYQRVRALEPWLEGSTAVAELAVLGAQSTAAVGETPSNQYAKLAPEVEGIAQLLIESAIQFDIVDPERADLTRYAGVVLPDGYVPSALVLERLVHARESGVKIVSSGAACLDAGRFLLPDFPVRYREVAPTVPVYLRFPDSDEDASGVAPDYDYVFYEGAHLVQAVGGAEEFGVLSRARHDRTWKQFTSHSHAPVGTALQSPVAVMSADYLYLAAPLFGAYARNEYWVYKAVARQLLEKFLGRQVLRFDGPSWVEATLRRQDTGDARRDLVHLTAFQARRSANPVPRVDEGGAVSGTAFTLRTDREVRSVYIAPSGEQLRFRQSGDEVTVELPPIQTYMVVAVE